MHTTMRGCLKHHNSIAWIRKYAQGKDNSKLDNVIADIYDCFDELDKISQRSGHAQNNWRGRFYNAIYANMLLSIEDLKLTNEELRGDFRALVQFAFRWYYNNRVIRK